MRLLIRLVFAYPFAVFIATVIAVVGAAVVAFVLSERRARALAELSDDPEFATSQRRRLVIVALVSVTVIAGMAWVSFFRVSTEPHQVLVAVSITDPDGLTQFDLGDDPGISAVRAELVRELETVGLVPVELDDSVAKRLRTLPEIDEASLQRAAQRAQARWLVRVRITATKSLALTDADPADLVLSVDAELVDSETGEVFAVPDLPARVLVAGSAPTRATAATDRDIATRITMPILASLAEREPLLALTGDRSQMTADQAVRAVALERLFARAQFYTRALAARIEDENDASEREIQDHAAVARTRIGDILAEEYWFGTAADGRSLLLTTPKHLSVVPDKAGYQLRDEGETLVLAERDGDSRTTLFEHYNFYSAPAVSADGRVVWVTVAERSGTKTLVTIDVATGEVRPVLSDADEYNTSPLPAPDGSRALFFTRPERYAETAIDVVGRDGGGRRTIIGTDELGGVPAWSADGREVYAPIGGWQRLVAIDVETGARRHLLGLGPHAPTLPDELDDTDDTVDDTVDDTDDDTDDPAPAVQPPADPRHGTDLDVPGEPDAATPDPASTSRFTAVSVGHDGRSLYVVEQSLDGRQWLGRLDLDVLDRLAAQPDPSEPLDPSAPAERSDPAPTEQAYVRLAGVGVGQLIASPNAAMVAFEAPAFTAPGDPSNRDQEVLVFGPEPGQLRAITLNEVDDELAGWSRDGRSLYTIQRSHDPSSDRVPVVRIYRHDLPD